MSLYHEASEVLDKARKGGGSLKSIVFGRKGWKSDAKTLFALSAETAKWSEVLSEVVENSDLLKHEKQLSPLLSLVLAHDLLLSKRGIVLPAKHGINVAVSRHKARLSAELTKARIRRGVATIDALRSSINNAQTDGADSTQVRYPRWVRVNSVRSNLEEQLASTFSDYDRVTDLGSVSRCRHDRRMLYIDGHVPDLVAIPPHIEITSTEAYKRGKLILQDKASCFPALLLDPASQQGGIIDACAAPGNKTTHLAALHTQASSASKQPSETPIFACEKDTTRTQTLSKMVNLAGAEKIVQVLGKQDFLRLNPQDRRFRSVTALLLDPSCSGSGIVGRDEATVTIHLPNSILEPTPSKSKKRKRGNDTQMQTTQAVAIDVPDVADETAEQEEAIMETNDAKLRERLAALSAFQLRVIEHAMSFPSATRITYSTCSSHDEENEHVVVKALHSSIARQRGWKILAKDQQVDGMRKWPRRGRLEAVQHEHDQHTGDGHSVVPIDTRLVADGCIRCQKGTEEMTMGFFLAGFVRDEGIANVKDTAESNGRNNGADEDNESEEWGGFSESE